MKLKINLMLWKLCDVKTANILLTEKANVMDKIFGQKKVTIVTRMRMIFAVMGKGGATNE